MEAPPRIKDVLIPVAIELYAKGGFSTSTTDEIIKQSKVSRGLIMYHFGNAEGMLREIFKERIEYMTNTLEMYTVDKGVYVCDDIISFWLETLQKDTYFWILHDRPELRAQSLVNDLCLPFWEKYQTLLSDCFAAEDETLKWNRIRAFEITRQGVLYYCMSEPSRFTWEELGNAWRAVFLR